MAINHEAIQFIKFFLFFTITITINAYKEIKSYRLIQYEAGESLFGSQYSNLNYIGSYYKGDNLRKIALVPLKEINDVTEIEKVLKSNANAILFMLPSAPYSEAFTELINSIQIYLSEQTLYIPVYFTYETEELEEITNQLKEEYRQSMGEEKKGWLNYLGISQNLLHFSLSSSEPKKVENLMLENFYGFLEAAPGGGAVANPIIAIVTYYDTFGISPDIPFGLNTNGSGVIAFLELIRILSKFYENYENVIKYDILFVLTSAGNLNFEGTQHFVNTLEASISENLQYVLCLDSLAAVDTDENEMYLHVSRFPKEHEEGSRRLNKIFNSTAENMNFTLNYIKKKVFLTNKVVPWEHEQFSKKKIISATLSGMSTPVVHNFNRTLITDTKIDRTTLKRNIKFLSESLLAFLFDYNINNFTIFKEDENLIDENNIESTISYLNKITRFPLSIEKNAPFNNDMYNFLLSYLQKTQRQAFEYKEMKFYDTNSGNVKVYSVKSKLIDLYLLIAISVYLLVLYIYSKGLKSFISGLRGAFDAEED